MIYVLAIARIGAFIFGFHEEWTRIHKKVVLPETPKKSEYFGFDDLVDEDDNMDFYDGMR